MNAECGIPETSARAYPIFVFIAPVCTSSRIRNTENLVLFRIPNSEFRIILALALLVLGVLADNHDFAVALDYLALLAHGLYGRSDFHCISSYLLLHVMRPRVTS